jgi:uncharacterized membrane protein
MDMFCFCIPSWNHFPHFYNSSILYGKIWSGCFQFIGNKVKIFIHTSILKYNNLLTGQTDINPSDPSRNNKNGTIYPDITIKEESINVYNAINDVSDIKELSTTIEEKTPVLGSDSDTYLEDTKGNKTRDVNSATGLLLSFIIEVIMRMRLFTKLTIQT